MSAQLTAKEQFDLFGVRFRDLVLHAFTLGKLAGASKFGASVLYQAEYETAMKLWEEVADFMRGQVAMANKQEPKKQEPKK